MSRDKLFKWFIPAIVPFIVISALAYYLYNNTTPSIDDIWVLNLDKDKERLQKVLDQQPLLPQRMNRWKATYGKEESREAAGLDGVNHILSESGDAELNMREPNVLHVPGEIGCWLSHKRLLRHLNTLDVSPNFGHLILEDDVLIDKDFLRKWDTVKRSIPGDWDFIYLGVQGDLVGSRINQHIVRWSNVGKLGNYGTYAYIVRHRALPHILEKIKYMHAAIDVQYFSMLGGLNIYIVDPPLVLADDDVVSTIDAQQLRTRF
jgi:GR25 family glycosyltransferase involved in LPS biosynthesis